VNARIPPENCRDEIEKVHRDVNNALLQVFGDGRLTDGKGCVVDFSDTVVISTSNLDASIIMENLEKSDKNRFGEGDPRESNGRVNGALRSRIPEPDRRGHCFHAPSRENIRAIVPIQIDHVVRTAAAQGGGAFHKSADKVTLTTVEAEPKPTEQKGKSARKKDASKSAQDREKSSTTDSSSHRTHALPLTSREVLDIV
jgi:ATP-dependent Clp protease ATP-binding subunit ClpA